MEKNVWIGIYILIGIYLLYKFFTTKSRFDDDYEKFYNDILTSEKYKVKGQYDK